DSLEVGTKLSVFHCAHADGFSSPIRFLCFCDTPLFFLLLWTEKHCRVLSPRRWLQILNCKLASTVLCKSFHINTTQLRRRQKGTNNVAALSGYREEGGSHKKMQSTFRCQEL